MGKNGKEIFEKFISEKKKNLKLHATIWMSLLAIAALTLTADIRIAGILAIFGAFMGYLNIKAWTQYKETMGRISNLNGLYEQLEKTGTKQFEDWKMIVTDEYVLSAYESFQIFPFSDIGKVEMGIQEEGLKPNKNIFITVKGDQERHRIAQAYSAVEIPASFYEAFDTIQKKAADHIGAGN